MKIPLARPAMTEKMIKAAADALRNERLVMGESVHKFEEKFAKYTGTDYAISCSSGTNALTMAQIAFGITNKKVYVPTMTFIATPNSAVHIGNTPMFVDCSNEDGNIDTDKIRIRDDVKAIIPVHLYGNPADMDTITEYMGDKIIIEDACQAHGAEYNHKKCGSLANAGCFSFYTTKNMTVGGDGGMVTTNDEKAAKDISSLRDCGRKTRYEHNIIGYTSRLNTVNAAIGLEQLKMLDKWNNKRREAAAEYRKQLKDCEEVITQPKPPKRKKPAYHLFAIQAKYRDKMAEYLKAQGIETGNQYPIPCHKQEPYISRWETQPYSLQASERWAAHVLTLPMFAGITKEQIKKVTDAIKECNNKGAKK